MSTPFYHSNYLPPSKSPVRDSEDGVSEHKISAFSGSNSERAKMKSVNQIIPYIRKMML
jgi:hypothetical protein